MKYTVDIICNGVWFNYSKDIKDSDFVNDSQKLVKDSVKENADMQKGGAEDDS